MLKEAAGILEIFFFLYKSKNFKLIKQNLPNIFFFEIRDF